MRVGQIYKGYVITKIESLEYEGKMMNFAYTDTSVVFISDNLSGEWVKKKD